MAGRMVRGALFNGATPVKFVASTPEQINLNQVSGVNDWRPVADTTLTLAAVPTITELPQDEGYRVLE